MNQKLFKLCFSLLLFSFSYSSWSQSITGIVKDANNETMPGVSIVLKGTTIGTTTDLDGKYTLTTNNSNGVLEFSFIGYNTQNVQINGRTVINVSMQASAEQLTELVVVGYGVQRKSDITGAIATLSAKNLLDAPVFNAVEGMKGKVSGVNVFVNSGAPGGSTRVVVRGVGTIQASSNPTYVVDGVIMEDFQFLNPNDIERMEVLKDASATAIYGARGANGVILVTTKRGGKNNETVVSYNSMMTISTLRKKMDVLNSREFMDVMEIGFANIPKFKPSDNAIAPILDRSDPRLFDTNGNPLYDTDWQSEALRTTFSHNHQVSVQTGGEKSSFGAFLNYSDEQGIMLRSYLKRINAKMTYDATLTSWLKSGINLSVNHTWGNEAQEDGGEQMPRRSMLEMLPIFPVKFPDGTWSNSNSLTAKPGWGIEGMANPVNVLETQTRSRKRTQIFGNFFLDFKLTEDLTLKTQIGVDNHKRIFEDYSPVGLTNISTNGRARIENYNSLYWQEETFLTYLKSFDDHNINAVFGFSWQEKTWKTNVSSAEGFSPDNFFGLNNIGTAITPGAPTSSFERWRMNSYFLRAAYNYQEKYLATFTARYDGSSRFGKNNKFGFFPSLGLGWMLSNEDFMKDISLINTLKLRTSIGLTGNTEIGNYNSLATISSGTVLINGERAGSSWISRLPNPSLKWEHTRQFDIGFNLAFLKNKINIELDYYNRKTSNLLLDRPIPTTTGYSSVLDNIGEISNKGIDLLITTRNIENDKWRWETSFTMNYNKNKAVKLGANNEDIFPGPDWVSGSQTILRVGESLSSFYGYERLGIWSEAEAAANPGVISGTAKRSADKKILGKGLPDFTGSLINRFYVGDFDFLLDIQYVFGVQILQQYYHSLEDRTGYANSLKSVLYDAWTPTNQNTMVQQIRNAPLSGQSSELDSRWVANGSYVRINNIAVGYTFRRELLDQAGIRSLRVYTSVTNPFVIHSSDFKGYDPEASSWSGNWAQNVFFFQYPRPIIFTLGLNLTF